MGSAIKDLSVIETLSTDPDCVASFYGLSNQKNDIKISNSTGLVQITKLNESMSETIEFYVQIGSQKFT